MRYLIALLLPWVAFLTVGKPFSAIACLILQCTLLAWPVAAIWAMFEVHEYHDRKRLERAVARLEALSGGHTAPQRAAFTPPSYERITAIVAAGLLLAIALVLAMMFP